MTREQFLAGVKAAGAVIAQVASVASAAGLPIAGAVATGIKIALGVAAEVPEAVALYDQFKSGQMPTQAELDAYAAEEDSAYSELMADIAAAEAASK